MSSLPATATHLTHFRAIRVGGADARTFLQGQLSADLDSLDAQRVLLGCCNSAQGRVQAVLWIVERSDGIALLVPASLAEITAARLSKYVLRSKVTLDVGSLDVGTLPRDALPAGVSLTGVPAHRQHADISYLALPGHDSLALIAPAPLAGLPPADEAHWRLEDIRAGLPQVYPSTHEAFVAQMLNLDLLGGISFEKGCYTGQEIIARAHYRGAVKRRMFRFKVPCPAPAPGTRILAGSQHAGDVVDAAPTSEGCELLAVVSVAQSQAHLQLDGAPDMTLEPAPLPYELG